MTLRTFAACCGVVQLILAAARPASAQVPVLPYNIGQAVRAAEEAQRGAPQPSGTAEAVLPQPVEPPLTLADKETLFVRRIEVDGPSLVDEKEVREVLSPYENRDLTLAEIYKAADKLSTLYRDHGYPVAKAYVPAQDARSGLLRIKLIPGQYGEIGIKNESLVRTDYLARVINPALGTSPFIRTDAVEHAMLLTSDLSAGTMPQVTIGPGQQQETSDFLFSLPEERRIQGFLLGDNFGSPYTGRLRASAGLTVNSPLGFGDRFNGYGIVSSTTGLVNGRIAYAFPMGFQGARGELGVFRTTYVLGGVYNTLDATGTALGFTATITYPIVRQRAANVYIIGNFTSKTLNDKDLGTSFANRTIDLGMIGVTGETVGNINGLPLTTATTFSVTKGYVHFPDPAQREANVESIDTAGSYCKINLAFNATLAFNETLSLTTTLRGQTSFTRSLDTSEQMTLSGEFGVRSYDEGVSGDSGYLVTPMLKYALPDISLYRHSVGVFTDVGAAWIDYSSYATTQKSYSQLNDIGLGYYATYQYSPARQLLLKALVAHTYGSDSGLQAYNRGTKGLVQIGLTF